MMDEFGFSLIEVVVVTVSLVGLIASSLALSLPGLEAFRRNSALTQIKELKAEVERQGNRIRALEEERLAYIAENERLRLDQTTRDYALVHAAEGIKALGDQVKSLSKGKVRPIYTADAISSMLPSVLCPPEP